MTSSSKTGRVSRNEKLVPPAKTVALVKVAKRSRSRGTRAHLSGTTAGLSKTLKRSSVSASRRSLSRSSTLKRSAASLKPAVNSSAPEKQTKMVMWGCNMSNQLGLKTSRAFVTMPKLCSWNINIAEIACGLDHCALVTTEGHVYTFGSNQNGKLGLGQSTYSKPVAPSLVEALAQVVIKTVSCGQEHTAAVTEDGAVYTWGLNTQGALGLGSRVTATDTPMLMEKQGGIVQVSCGSH